MAAIAPVSNPLLTGPGLTSLADIFLGKNTKSSESTSEIVSPEGTAALVKQALEGTNGLAAISGGQKAAGMYNSSTGTLLTNDLLSRITGEVAARNKVSTTTKSIQQQPQVNPKLSALTTLGLSLGGKELFSGAKKAISTGIDGIKVKNSVNDAVLNGEAADDGTTEGINAALNSSSGSGVAETAGVNATVGEAAGSAGVDSGADLLGNIFSGTDALGASAIDSGISAGVDTGISAATDAGIGSAAGDTAAEFGADEFATLGADASGAALATSAAADVGGELGASAVAADVGADFGLADLADLLAAFFFSKGGMIQNKAPGYKGGGKITGPGTTTSDSVPIMASPGEYMLPAEVTDAIGKENLDSLVHMITGQKPVGAR